MRGGAGPGREPCPPRGSQVARGAFFHAVSEERRLPADHLQQNLSTLEKVRLYIDEDWQLINDCLVAVAGRGRTQEEAGRGGEGEGGLGPYFAVTLAGPVG